MAKRRGVSRRSFLGWSAAGVTGALMSGGVLPEALAAGGVDDRLAAGTGWRDFLGALDLTWQSMPTGFYQGPFLGNGGFGAAVYQRSGALAFTLGDSRVRDHQRGGDPLWGGARLPIGYLSLRTAGTITSVDLRLSLWDAELTGLVHTSTGSVTVRAFVHATTDVLVVNTAVAAGTETVTWSFTPLDAVSPRKQFYAAPSGLLTNPAPAVTSTATGGTCVQDLACGGRTETRWTQRAETDGTTTLVATVAHSATDHSASTTAANTMAAAAALAQLRTTHRTWWNAFYPKSFVSVPDTRLQALYWIQLYKMASATRAGRPVLSTTGPWLEPTPWPAVWWNLNVQLEYWLLNATGHTELDSLRTALEGGGAGLTASTPSAYRSDSLVLGRSSQEDMWSAEAGVPGQTSPTPEIGNLTWALHNAWLAYRHTMDDAYLRNTVFPLLRKAINYYLRFLTKDASGVYHLPTTYSPEYGTTSDCNYDLALIFWGCRTLIAAADRLGITDPLAATWQDVLTNLTPPPQDATDGLWIGKDLKLTSSHRHYSHLLWFYPLANYQVTDPTQRALLVRSMNHWLSLTGALQGYSFTGSASMYAQLGDGTNALARLNSLITGYIKPNTMYAETGPVIETPLSAAQSLHDMLLQSWGDTIRVFPAVPSAWADVVIHDLRTEGAFLVSARRRAGATEFVRVRSLKGEPCKVLPTGFGGAVTVQRIGSTASVPWSQDAAGVLTITMAAGDEVVITRSGASPAIVVEPVVTPTKASWGLPPAAGGTPVDLAAFLSNDGVSWPGTAADFDGGGYSYPAEDFPTAGLFVSGGVTWRIPSTSDTKANNVVAAGQVLTVPSGKYTELHVLGAGTYGNASGPVTLTYTDGSTSTATLNLADWGKPPAFGELVAVHTTHRHSGTGDQALKVRLFHQKVAVTGTKDLRSITLPSLSRLHIFAMTVR